MVRIPSAGACGGQFTANTMACVSEAIGLALPNSSGAPAPYKSRDEYGVASGAAVMNLIEKNIRAYKIHVVSRPGVHLGVFFFVWRGEI